MFAEWVTVGVSWGIKIAFAAFTILVIVGFMIGLMSILTYFVREGREGNEDKNQKQGCNRPTRGR